MASISVKSRAKEIVRCEASFEDRTPFGNKSSSSAKPEQNMIRILKCEMREIMTGVSYNTFSVNISDLYEFYELRSDSTIYNGSDFYSFFVESNSSLFEVAFEYAEWQFLPNQIESIFPKINSLNVTFCELSILDKQNMMQFGDKLIFMNFAYNLLTFLTGDLFEYNKNLKYCDFSENPLKFIDQSFRNNTSMFNFFRVDCSYFQPRCEKSEYIINYERLKSNLQREFDEIDMNCSITTYSIDDSSHDLDELELFLKELYISSPVVVIYECEMEVLNPRVRTTETNLYVKVSEKINDTSMGITLKFYGKRIVYIPERLVDAVNQRVDTLKIIKCGLTSITEHDMKQFGENIILAYFTYNKLKVLGKNVFNNNINLRFVLLDKNSFLFIDWKYLLMDYPQFNANVTMKRCGDIM